MKFIATLALLLIAQQSASEDLIAGKLSWGFESWHFVRCSDAKEFLLVGSGLQSLSEKVVAKGKRGDYSVATEYVYVRGKVINKQVFSTAGIYGAKIDVVEVQIADQEVGKNCGGI